ncbi:hypothetical protein [Clostridium weizhouense]|uniref:Secreted protein n=1 Tax=Clostridium weizhouense TaxID=2859781 RepID=A0ABS7ANB1_9CLOT|nr:hypothetical protein [Clostridium weizhouense]MBW6409171.1 hypothetical protein [Clostridium weizhouense]
MAKPSIFSKEYEKRMKKRKRKFIIIFSIVFAITILAIVKISYSTRNYSDIKQRIQAWIDSDTIPRDNKSDLVTEDSSKESNIKQDEKIEEQALEIKLASGTVIKAMYIEENGQNKFTTLEGGDDFVKFDISPSGKQILILDKDQNITIYNINGESKVVSKNEYTSKKGDVFTKEATLLNQPEYLWNSNPKFINEESIVFVSNRPYFGTSAVKQYLWVTNIVNNSDSIKWDLAASKIEIGKKEEKGIKIIIDGNIYYVIEDGNIIQ